MTIPRPWSALKSFVKLIYAKWAGYETLASPEVFARRCRMCSRCKFRDGEQCGVCGCLYEAKASLATEECPRFFWESIWTHTRPK